MSVTEELIREEDVGCSELHELIHRFDRDRGLLDRVGYTEEWSVKDMLAHLGSWCAEAVRALEQIRMGTHERVAVDVEAKNVEFHDTWKDVDVDTIRAEFFSARNRMLEEWGRLQDPNRLAQSWFRESGPKHYAEHLPRLREWAEEVVPA